MGCGVPVAGPAEVVLMTVLMETIFGSHLYGTATASSDRDWKCVEIPPARDILLQRARPTIVTKTKADPTTKNTEEDVDVEVWALHQFFKLVTGGQPVAMDVLFSPPWAWPQPAHPIWLEIVANYDRLVSREASSFLRYCREQANKYGIKGSRVAAAEHAVEVFARLLERSSTQTKLQEVAGSLRDAFAVVEHCEITDIMVGQNRIVPHLSVCNRKVPFTASIKLAHEIYRKLRADYGVRARQAKENNGADWKAMSHAVRVGRQALELLATGRIVFPRPEAAHLLAVKKGELPYVEVAEEIEELLAAVEAAQETSPLPPTADRAFMDEMICRAYRMRVAADRV